MDVTRRFLGPPLVAIFALGFFLVGCNVIDNLTSSDKLLIQKFTVSPDTISPGTTATMAWDVQGAENIQIDNGVGKVLSKGTRQLEPQWTTTYTLIARGGGTSATATAQVIVRTPQPGPTPTPTPTPGPTPTP